MNAKPQTEQVLHVSPDQLTEREDFNVRLADDPDNIAHIDRIAEAIFNTGTAKLAPLTAYLEKSEGRPDNLYVVTDGHCRLAGIRQAMARGAPVKTVRIILEPKKATEADYTFGMIARNAGKPLSSLELGIACNRMEPFGWTPDHLAKSSGYSLQHIRNVMSLAAGPEEITKLVETGQVSATLATEVMQADGDNAAETLRDAVEIAKEEHAAKPAPKPRKDGKVKPAAKPKATLKHVVKAKGLPSKPSAKKMPKQPEPSPMMSTDKLVQSVTNARTATEALGIFDMLGSRRSEVLGELMVRWGDKLDMKAGNDKSPDLETVGLLFGRAVADMPDADGVVTLVMRADDWDTACEILKIKQPAEA